MELLYQHLPALLALLIAGVCAGLLAGLLGIGGGLILVPTLFFIFQQFGVSPDSAIIVATGTSLATIVLTSISSVKAHHSRGNVDWALLKVWAPFIVGGVLFGSWLIHRIDGQWITALFGALALFAAYKMYFKSPQAALTADLPSLPGQALMAGTVGTFSTLVGIGGATIGVPMLTACSYPAHKAVGTAAGFGLMISLPAAVTLITYGVTPVDAPPTTFGLVNAAAFACIVPLTVIFAPIGAAIGTKVDPNRLKKMFSVILLITGVRMLVQFAF